MWLIAILFTHQLIVLLFYGFDVFFTFLIFHFSLFFSHPLSLFYFSIFFHLILCMPICCSLGDGIQYPVQIKQLLESASQHSANNDSMIGTSAVHADDTPAETCNDRKEDDNSLRSPHDELEVGLLNTANKPANQIIRLDGDAADSQSVDIAKLPVWYKTSEENDTYTLFTNLSISNYNIIVECFSVPL